MSELNSREQELVALGAAIASNCVPKVEFHIPEARSARLSDTQIKEAVKIADKVRRVPARAVLQTAMSRLEESPKEMADPAGAACGCSESSPRADSDCVSPS